nr:MAG TPA: hypothetical protein [Caudoviricetes sp.]
MNSFHFYFLISLLSFERRFLSGKMRKIICPHYLSPITFFFSCDILSYERRLK